MKEPPLRFQGSNHEINASLLIVSNYISYHITLCVSKKGEVP